MRWYTAKGSSPRQGLLANDKRDENGHFEPQDLTDNFANTLDLDGNSGGGDVILCSTGSNQQLEAPLGNQDDLKNKDLIDMKIRELAIQHESSGASMYGHAVESTIPLITATTNDVSIGKETFQKAQKLTEEKNEQNLCGLALYPTIASQLLQGMKELSFYRRANSCVVWSRGWQSSCHEGSQKE